MTDDAPENKFRSRAWRLQNLYYIQNKDGKRVKFNPNAAQRKFLKTRKNRDIILKARQLGMTTLACILGLDEALWVRDWRVLIIAHTRDDAMSIFDTKVRYPYDNLPDIVRERFPLKNNTGSLLSFDHGSSIRVASSGRGGTYQRLHVSEFGKICAVYPARAREIITGALPAVGKNIATIESTAEGQSGAFFEMTDKAMERVGKANEDWRFHFYPWFDDVANVYDPARVVIGPDDHNYFDKVEAETGRKLSLPQRAWWVWQEETLGGDMKRENPSTPKEAFEQAIRGAYFADQIAYAVKKGHIGRFDYDPMYPVNTFWDLGRNDMNTIWMHQYINQRHRFIGYYENSGEHISHYINWLRKWAKLVGAQFGDHYWPHDGDRDDLFLEHGRLGTVEREYKFLPRVVSRVSRKIEGVEAVRKVFASCDFDEVGCKVGLDRLRNYRKKYDANREIFLDQPEHDHASHGCFVGETLVLTSRGRIRIDAVKVGDRVHTPAGLARVEWAGLTKRMADLVRVTLSDGRILTCTPSHKIFSASGLCRADALMIGEKVYSENDTPCLRLASAKPARYRDAFSESFAGSNTGSGRAGEFMPARSAGASRYCIGRLSALAGGFARKMAITRTLPQKIGATISPNGGGRKLGLSRIRSLMAFGTISKKTKDIGRTSRAAITCIAPFGGIILGSFLRGVTYTTLMVTSPTMRLKTCDASARPNTASCTEKQTLGLGVRKTSGSFARLGKRLMTGGEHLRVARNFLPRSQRLSPHIPLGSVNSAGLKCASPVGVLKDGSALYVVSVERLERAAPVYDLTVRDHHCYFADGVLVSNSDGFMTFATGYNPPVSFEPAAPSLQDDLNMGRALRHEEYDDDEGGGRVDYW